MDHTSSSGPLSLQAPDRWVPQGCPPSPPCPHMLPPYPQGPMHEGPGSARKWDRLNIRGHNRWLGNWRWGGGRSIAVHANGSMKFPCRTQRQQRPHCHLPAFPNPARRRRNGRGTPPGLRQSRRRHSPPRQQRRRRPARRLEGSTAPLCRRSPSAAPGRPPRRWRCARTKQRGGIVFSKSALPQNFFLKMQQNSPHQGHQLGVQLGDVPNIGGLSDIFLEVELKQEESTHTHMCQSREKPLT